MDSTKVHADNHKSSVAWSPKTTAWWSERAMFGNFSCHIFGTFSAEDNIIMQCFNGFRVILWYWERLNALASIHNLLSYQFKLRVNSKTEKYTDTPDHPQTEIDTPDHSQTTIKSHSRLARNRDKDRLKQRQTLWRSERLNATRRASSTVSHTRAFPHAKSRAFLMHAGS